MLWIPRTLQKIETPTWTIILLAWLSGLYFLLNFTIYQIFPPDLAFFFIQPLLCASLAGVSWLGYLRLPKKPAFARRLTLWAVSAGLLQFILFFIAAFFFQFGKSPYGSGPLVFIGNLVYVLTWTLGFELLRSFLGAALGERNPEFALGCVTVLLTLAAISPGQFSLLLSPDTAFQFLGQTVLPGLAKNLLATYLAMSGGPLAAMGYMGVLMLAEWLPPVLPNLPWLASAFLGTFIPLICLGCFDNWFSPQKLPVPEEDADGELELGAPNGLLFSWVAIALLAVGLLGFNTGIFGVQPVLVSGGSMNPTLWAGDIVVTQAVNPATLAVGDIVRFRKGDSEVIHRIVALQFEAGPLVLITRGDNNNAADAPVQPADVRGKVIFTIPKAGWLPLILRGNLVGSRAP